MNCQIKKKECIESYQQSKQSEVSDLVKTQTAMITAILASTSSKTRDDQSRNGKGECHRHRNEESELLE